MWGDEDASLHLLSFLDLCTAYALGSTTRHWRHVLFTVAPSRGGGVFTTLRVPTIHFQEASDVEGGSFRRLFERFGGGLRAVELAAPHLKGYFKRSLEALLLSAPRLQTLRVTLCDNTTFPTAAPANWDVEAEAGAALRAL